MKLKRKEWRPGQEIVKQGDVGDDGNGMGGMVGVGWVGRNFSGRSTSNTFRVVMSIILPVERRKNDEEEEENKASFRTSGAGNPFRVGIGVVRQAQKASHGKKRPTFIDGFIPVKTCS